MTTVDINIKAALDSIGVEFYPVQFKGTGLVGITNDPKQAGCLSITTSTSPILSNGNVVDTHYFYMFQRRKEDIDILNDINTKQLLNVQNAIKLINKLSVKHKITEKGEKTPFIDLLDCLECGQEFILEIEYNPAQCS